MNATKHTKLTLEMINNDGWGGNLKGPYSRYREEVVRDKAEEYAYLARASVNVRRLVLQYRLRKLGLLKTLRLSWWEHQLEAAPRKIARLQAPQTPSWVKDDAPFPF